MSNDEVYIMEVDSIGWDNPMVIYKRGRRYNVYKKVWDDEKGDVVEEPFLMGILKRQVAVECALTRDEIDRL